VEPFGRRGGASLATAGTIPTFKPLYLAYAGLLVVICAAAAFLCTKSSPWQKWQNRAGGKSHRPVRR